MGLAALLLAVPLGRLRLRIDRQRRLGRHDRCIEQWLTVAVQGVPDREGHPEEALATDQPVTVESLDPVLVAGPHVVRVPLQLASARDERSLESALVVTSTVAQVPLAAGDDL